MIGIIRNRSVNSKRSDVTDYDEEVIDDESVINTEFHSVRVGYYTDMGVMKKRDSNEDRISVITEFKSSLLTAYVSVIDGHTGAKCAEYVDRYLKSSIPSLFSNEDTWTKADSILLDLFHELEEEFRKSAQAMEELSGACATVLLVRDKQVIVAYIGDCRVMHCNKKGSIIRVTEDHRADTIQETKRMVEAGGQVVNGRVGTLQPSRAFGDIEVKSKVGKNVVIATPEIVRFEVSQSDYVIVASDGLWDNVTNRQVALKCKKYLVTKHDPQHAAEKLTHLAIKNASYDDISVAVLAF